MCKESDDDPVVAAAKYMLGLLASLRPTPQRAVDAPQRGDFYGPLEAKIMSVAAPEWQTADNIATLIGEPNSSHFRATISNLAYRNCLEAMPGKGYRLPSADPGGSSDKETPL